MDAIIGRKIFMLRHENNYTQERLANEADISQSRISVIENAHESPTWEEMKKITSVFHRPVSSILPEEAGFIMNNEVKDNAQNVQNTMNSYNNFEEERKALLLLLEAKDEIIKLLKNNK